MRQVLLAYLRDLAWWAAAVTLSAPVVALLWGLGGTEAAQAASLGLLGGAMMAYVVKVVV